MSWILVSKQQQEEMERQALKMLQEKCEEHERKRKSKEAWLKLNTCEHCGRHDHIPPWFV